MQSDKFSKYIFDPLILHSMIHCKAPATTVNIYDRGRPPNGSSTTTELRWVYFQETTGYACL